MSKKNNQERTVLAANLGSLVGPAVAGLAGAVAEPLVGEVSSQLLGQVAGQKAGDALNQPSDGDIAAPAKGAVDTLTGLETRSKDLQTAIGYLTGQNAQTQGDTAGKLLDLFQQAGIPPTISYPACQAVFQQLSTQMAGGDVNTFLTNYTNILITMLKANPEQPKVAIQKVLEIVNFEKQYPFFSDFGYQPSKLAMKKLSGGNINDDLNSMLMLAYASGGSAEYKEVGNAINSFNRILELGATRTDQFGVQDMWKIHQQAQTAKEQAYIQHGKVLLSLQEGYDELQKGMAQSLTALGLPTAWASLTATPLMMISFVKNLGGTIGGGPAPAFAFVEDLNMRLAYGNHDYRYAQAPATPSTPTAPISIPPAIPSSSTPGSPVSMPSGGVSTAPAPTTTPATDLRHSNFARMLMPGGEIDQTVNMLDRNASIYSQLAPTVDNPVNTNLSVLSQGDLMGFINNQLGIVNKIKPFVLQHANFSLNPSGSASATSPTPLGNDIANSWIKATIFKLQNYEATLEAIKVSYSFALPLVKLEKQLQKEKAASESYLGFQGSQLSLPAINVETMININMRIKDVYDQAAQQYTGLSGSDLLTGLASGCQAKATEALSAASKLMQQYNLGGMHVGAGVNSIDRLERLAETRTLTFDEVLKFAEVSQEDKKTDEDDDAGCDFSELLAHVKDKSDDEIYDYFNDLLPGYGKLYEDIGEGHHQS